MNSSSTLLRSLLVETKDGEWGQPEPFDGSVEMAVIRGTDFETAKKSSLEGVPVRHIAYKAAGRKTLQAFDILIETAGGSKGKPTGKTTFLRPALFERSVLPITCASFARFLRIDATRADPEFVYWYLQSLYLSGVIENYQVQHTGIARFQFTKFADSVEIDLPPMDEQVKVSAFLGAIENRISLLGETNATLETIAQALFKSWFVDFDPVRAKAEGLEPEGLDVATAALFPCSFDESALGGIPRGWKVGSLSEVCSISSGKRPSIRSDIPIDYCDVPLFGGAGLMGYTSNSLFQSPKIVTGRVGTLGKVHVAYPPFWASDNVLVLHPEASASFSFVLHWLKSIDVIALNRGSTQPLLTQRDLGAQQGVIPTQEVLQKFEGVVGPIYDQIRLQETKAQTLTQLRDTLLPRLISGQLRLPEAKATTEKILSEAI
ncbi:restriction endonuclease subunit S [Pseudomonas protegens]|uniref:Type I restriction modification DNA specificity domain-containing protein n=1 Tax=Pseudomonas protegens TaxID=380021 RepID=A0A9Q6N7B5_9PSED|nr:restriction endonuclease subunit S [Pseudomonas protegens]PYC33466.1 hypothetical protein DMX08_20340 [Pseudomonas protegens]